MAFDINALSLADFATLAFAFALGGLVKGTVGMGLPMIAVPILSTVLDPRTAIATIMLPNLGANILQAHSTGNIIQTTVAYRRLTIPLLLGSVAGTMVITSIPMTQAALILGGLVSLFAVSTLAGWRPTLPSGIDRRLRPIVGAISGVIGGMSSFLAPTLVPYLMTLNLEKTAFIHIMGVLFFLGQLPLFVGLALTGFAPPSVLAISAAGWLAVGVAMNLGKRLRDRIPQHLFMTLVGIMLLTTGLNMIRRVLF
ncbi:MAG: sulfite exporter TauE/SafE family protein [Rhodospirillaceae bacterium]|nr:sulfite exporter TauE/SafE family protein [Rhodospirillaceae bacterium]